MAKPCKHTMLPVDEIYLCAGCGLTDDEIELEAEVERLTRERDETAARYFERLTQIEEKQAEIERLRETMRQMQEALRKAMDGECCSDEEVHTNDCPAPKAMSAAINALSEVPVLCESTSDYNGSVACGFAWDLISSSYRWELNYHQGKLDVFYLYEMEDPENLWRKNLVDTKNNP